MHQTPGVCVPGVSPEEDDCGCHNILKEISCFTFLVPHQKDRVRFLMFTSRWEGFNFLNVYFYAVLVSRKKKVNGIGSAGCGLISILLRQLPVLTQSELSPGQNI